MRTRAGVLACLGLLLSACGDIQETVSDAGPESDATEFDAAPRDPCAAGANPTFDEGVACIRTALCGIFSRCLAPFEEGQCDENLPFTIFGANSQFNEHAIVEAIEAGLINYDPEAIAACLAFFNETSCQEFTSTSEEFIDICPFLTGTVADGDDCVIDFECATPHAVCSEVTKCEVDDVCCVHGCVPPSPIDGECDEFDDTRLCEPGAHCVNGGDLDFCRPGDDGSQCSSSSDCDAGFFCEDGSCRPEIESEAACYDDNQCPGPETCLGDDLEGGKVSQVCGRSDREGDPCDGSCAGFFCDQPSEAELGTCVPYLREEGADCSVMDCALPGFVCDRAADQCVPRLDIGEVCSDAVTQQCLFGLFCTGEIIDQPEGTCSGPQPDRARCNDDSQCDSGICGGNPDEPTCQPYPGCYE